MTSPRVLILCTGNGRPGLLLVAKARSDRFSLLVIGNQGRGYMTEAFLGRAAHHVVHHSPIPVLLVPLSGGKP